MPSPLYRDLARRHPDVALLAANVSAALQRLPDHVFHPEFAFTVTAHHLTRFVHSFVPRLKVVDGCLDCFKDWHAHSWLETPGYIIDASPMGIACERPIIIPIDRGTIWGRWYNATLPIRPLSPHIDAETMALLQLAEKTRGVLSAY